MSILYLVPTPLGNLEDITLRSIRILKEADVILAEDTRTSGVLLRHLGIEKRILAHHQHNEHNSAPEIVKMLQAGQTVAMVTDAGTPGISDPGFLLVRECIRAGVEVQTLPGPVAFVPALVNSGLPCEKFVFEGFLPQKKGRQTRFLQLAEEPRTMVFYESPHKIKKTLEQMCEYFGADRQASISRELTKIHEETLRGSLQGLVAHFQTHEPRGEIVLVVAGREK